MNGSLGDVIKVDVAALLAADGVSLADVGLDPAGFGLAATTNGKGVVAQTDTYAADLSKGVFYFAPTVAGTPLDYGTESARADAGLDDSQLTVTNGSASIPIKLHVTDGATTTGDGAVTFGTKKLAVYRRQQRLAYMGYPNASSGGLTVDGVGGTGTVWAEKLFSIATDPATLGRGLLPNPSSGTKWFKAFINTDPAPLMWEHLTPVISFADPRQYGTHYSGQFIADALDNLADDPTSNGVSKVNGSSPPSKTHDGGCSVDIEDVEKTPGVPFYRVRGAYTVVSVANALPAGLAYVSSLADVGTYAPAAGLWTVGNLQAGATINLQVTARVVVGGSLANTAEVAHADEADSTPSNGVAGEDDQATVVPAVSGGQVTDEGEAATLTKRAAVAAKYAGYAGTGYVTYRGRGSAATFGVTLAAPQTSDLIVRYANGKRGHLPLQVFADDVLVGTFQCASTGRWTTWGTETIEDVALPAGAVSVRVAVATAAGGPDLDSLTVGPADRSSTTLQAESATLAKGVRRGTSRTGYDGAGYVTLTGKAPSVTFNYAPIAARVVGLQFRYANSGRVARPLTVYVGTTAVGTVAFAPAGRGWSTATLSGVSLPSGPVMIRIAGLTKAGSPDLDALTVAVTG